MNNKDKKLYIDIAQRVAAESHCERSKVGCICVKDRQILSSGYNGSPPGWDNCCEIDNVTKREVIHAEMNCLGRMAQSTISSQGASIFCTMQPCFDCAKLIQCAGIKEVFYITKYRDELPLDFLQRCGINVEQILY